VLEPNKPKRFGQNHSMAGQGGNLLEVSDQGLSVGMGEGFNVSFGNRFMDWIKKKNSPSTDNTADSKTTGGEETWQVDDYDLENTINKRIGSSLTIGSGGG
jgi:hypothetical protein